ncbi:MAG TPA: hypothetical protein VEA69_02375 [Tepidisphaeraceae bacterium]|nr:hypothetical protein [Tepidisphaeraceae bacterium]
MSDPQKSEVHESTADASTSPTGAHDQETTRRQKHDDPGVRYDQPDDRGRLHHPGEVPRQPLTDAEIVSDQTDDGGPLVIRSADPDLNPPRTPKDPFPTDRKPEIDPPIK